MGPKISSNTPRKKPLFGFPKCLKAAIIEPELLNCCFLFSNLKVVSSEFYVRFLTNTFIFCVTGAFHLSSPSCHLAEPFSTWEVSLYNSNYENRRDGRQNVPSRRQWDGCGGEQGAQQRRQIEQQLRMSFISTFVCIGAATEMQIVRYFITTCIRGRWWMGWPHTTDRYRKQTHIFFFPFFYDYY